VLLVLLIPILLLKLLHALIVHLGNILWLDLHNVPLVLQVPISTRPYLTVPYVYLIPILLRVPVVAALVHQVHLLPVDHHLVNLAKLVIILTALLPIAPFVLLTLIPY
jgi:hypothetical protein